MCKIVLLLSTTSSQVPCDPRKVPGTSQRSAPGTPPGLLRTKANYKRPRAERTSLQGRSDYVLSGLLRCGACWALMEIMRGSSASYYACSGARKRGTCSNRVSLREDIAKETMSAAVLELTWNPETLIRAREELERKHAAGPLELEKTLAESKARLARLEERARKLLDMQLAGDDSPTVADARREAETHAKAERVAIDQLNQELKAPMAPAPELDVERALYLSDVFEAKGPDVVYARERLKTLFGGQPVFLHPEKGEDGRPYYRAEAVFLPFALLAPTNAETPLGYHERRRPLVVARGRYARRTTGRGWSSW
jgi:hypothetical protein